MVSVFHDSYCLSTDSVSPATIRERCRGTDPRYVGETINRIIDLNHDVLEWMDTIASVEGTLTAQRLRFTTGRYVGVVPLRLPPSGKIGGDYRILPRLTPMARRNDDAADADPAPADALKNLYDIIEPIGPGIQVIYRSDLETCSDSSFRPPLYFEARRFLRLVEELDKRNWRCFVPQTRDYAYPKASTDWTTYAARSYDPARRLIYPAKMNVMSREHDEWTAMVRIAYQAVDIIEAPNVPTRFRLSCRRSIDRLRSRYPRPTGGRSLQLFSLRSHEPEWLTQVKTSANVILSGIVNERRPWRIDMAEVFERYVQYVFEQASRQVDGVTVLDNCRFAGHGNVRWQLRYLEPDLLLSADGVCIPVDAKYKANLYAGDVDSETLRKTHRADLHQVLAYASFSPQTNKTAIIAYPSWTVTKPRRLRYDNPWGPVTNTVYLTGIPLDASAREQTITMVATLLHDASATWQEA